MVPVSYSYRNLLVRWKMTLMTAAGFTLVVSALVIMLAFVKGIQVVCATTGEPENVVILSRGNSDEVLSQLPHTLVTQVESTPGIAHDDSGRLLASREQYMMVHHHNEETGEFRFLQVRGVLPTAMHVHSYVRIKDGRMYRPGQSEILIGSGVQREHGIQIGDTIPMGRKEWTVVGVFSAGGAAFEAEMWGDLTEIASQFRREGTYTTLVLRADDGDAATDLAERIRDSLGSSVDAKSEIDYYAKQSEQTNYILVAAWIISCFMGIGAVFGVMNTMFAAIAQRTKDIAVLRILGFKAKEILIAFLLEAVLISLIGGLAGGAIGYFANGFTRSMVIGAREVAFAFHVSPTILGAAVGFSAFMGIIGGVLPALSAMRVSPLEALR